MYINQISTLDYGIQESVDFFEKLWTSQNLIHKRKWFDQASDASSSSTRIKNQNISLESFLKKDNTPNISRLQISSPEPFIIRYVLTQYDKNKENEYFGWQEFEHNQENFNEISDIFHNTFHTKLQDIKEPEYLKKYFLQRLDL